MSLRDVGAFAMGGALTLVVSWLVGERAKDIQAPILNGWPRVVIVGAGFGGINAARKLSKVNADVLVVDRQNYHLFQPLLYQVATAGLEPEEIAHPVRQILRGLANVRFRMATVSGVDFTTRELTTDVGPIPFDYLILAAGSTTNYFRMDQLAAHANSLKGLTEAVALRNHLLSCFERAIAVTDPIRRRALLTFVVGGGGPTGVEFAGALAELIRLVLVHDYVGLDIKECRVILVESGPALLPAMAPSLQRAALVGLRQKGVDVRLNLVVRDFDGGSITLGDAERVPTTTLVWAAGVRAVELGGALGVPLERAGRVPVGPTLQVEGHPETYVIGDLAHVALDGGPLPMVAPVAIQQGELAAENIRRAITGLPQLSFSYKDKGSMATIGRNSAVAQIGGLKLTGFLAWIAWLGVHLLQIVSFRNRLLVFINWVWDYVYFDRAVRLITKD